MPVIAVQEGLETCQAPAFHLLATGAIVLADLQLSAYRVGGDPGPSLRTVFGLRCAWRRVDLQWHLPVIW
jgi:hypothetical protein